jgi:hypothetical protein
MPVHWSILSASAAGLDPMHRNPPESKEPLCRGPLPGTLALTTEVRQGAATSTFVHWHHLLIHKMAKHNSAAAPCAPVSATAIDTIMHQVPGFVKDQQGMLDKTPEAGYSI